LRIATPKIKANLVAILAALLIAYLDQEYYFFGNIAKLTNSIFTNIAESEKAGLPFYGRFIMASIFILIGRMIIPFCFARLGVMIVDKIKKKKNNHSVTQGTSQ